jgi:DNA-binding MarR family transcriptional regulator
MVGQEILFMKVFILNCFISKLLLDFSFPVNLLHRTALVVECGHRRPGTKEWREYEMTNNEPLPSKDHLAGALLEFFYPIHYQVGKALEEAMCQRQLSRKQVVILWIIHAGGAGGRQIPRKEILHLIGNWFEISSPAITQALRTMARPPLNLVRLTEAPNSGREQVVVLTRKGEHWVTTMINQGRQLLRSLLDHLPEEDMQAIVALYQRNVPQAVRHLRSDPPRTQRRSRAKE